MSIWDQKAELADNLISLNRELVRLAVGLERNNELLQEHMRRTEILEQQMETALLPIRAAKVFAAILGVVGTAITAWVAWHKAG